MPVDINSAIDNLVQRGWSNDDIATTIEGVQKHADDLIRQGKTNDEIFQTLNATKLKDKYGDTTLFPPPMMKGDWGFSTGVKANMELEKQTGEMRNVVQQGLANAPSVPSTVGGGTNLADVKPPTAMQNIASGPIGGAIETGLKMAAEPLRFTTEALTPLMPFGTLARQVGGAPTGRYDPANPIPEVLQDVFSIGMEGAKKFDKVVEDITTFNPELANTIMQGMNASPAFHGFLSQSFNNALRNTKLYSPLTSKYAPEIVTKDVSGLRDVSPGTETPAPKKLALEGPTTNERAPVSSQGPVSPVPPLKIEPGAKLGQISRFKAEVDPITIEITKNARDFAIKSSNDELLAHTNNLLDAAGIPENLRAVTPEQSEYTRTVAIDVASEAKRFATDNNVPELLARSNQIINNNGFIKPHEILNPSAYDAENFASDLNIIVNDKPKADLELLKDSKVRNEDGSLKEVYHGTSRVFDEYSLGHAKPGIRQVEGIWHTESPELASGTYAIENNREVESAQVGLSTAQNRIKELQSDMLEGRISREEGLRIIKIQEKDIAEFKDILEKRKADAPNVRPAYLNIKKPFDWEGKTEGDDRLRIADSLEQYVNDKKDLLSIHWGVPQDTPEFNNKLATSSTGAVIDIINDIRRGSIIDNSRFMDALDSFIAPKYHKRIMQEAGFDGYTHMGGTGRYGSAPTSGEHRVWIAFEPGQVISKFDARLYSQKIKDIVNSEYKIQGTNVVRTPIEPDLEKYRNLNTGWLNRNRDIIGRQQSVKEDDFTVQADKEVATGMALVKTAKDLNREAIFKHGTDLESAIGIIKEGLRPGSSISKGAGRDSEGYLVTFEFADKSIKAEKYSSPYGPTMHPDAYKTKEKAKEIRKIYLDTDEFLYREDAEEAYKALRQELDAKGLTNVPIEGVKYDLEKDDGSYIYGGPIDFSQQRSFADVITRASDDKLFKMYDETFDNLDNVPEAKVPMYRKRLDAIEEEMMKRDPVGEGKDVINQIQNISGAPTINDLDYKEILEGAFSRPRDEPPDFGGFIPPPPDLLAIPPPIGSPRGLIWGGKIQAPITVFNKFQAESNIPFLTRLHNEKQIGDARYTQMTLKLEKESKDIIREVGKYDIPTKKNIALREAATDTLEKIEHYDRGRDIVTFIDTNGAMSQMNPVAAAARLRISPEQMKLAARVRWLYDEYYRRGATVNGRQYTRFYAPHQMTQKQRLNYVTMLRDDDRAFFQHPRTGLVYDMEPDILKNLWRYQREWGRTSHLIPWFRDIAKPIYEAAVERYKQSPRRLETLNYTRNYILDAMRLPRDNAVNANTAMFDFVKNWMEPYSPNTANMIYRYMGDERLAEGISHGFNQFWLNMFLRFRPAPALRNAMQREFALPLLPNGNIDLMKAQYQLLRDPAAREKVVKAGLLPYLENQMVSTNKLDVYTHAEAGNMGSPFLAIHDGINKDFLDGKSYAEVADKWSVHLYPSELQKEFRELYEAGKVGDIRVLGPTDNAAAVLGRYASMITQFPKGPGEVPEYARTGPVAKSFWLFSTWTPMSIDYFGRLMRQASLGPNKAIDWFRIGKIWFYMYAADKAYEGLTGHSLMSNPFNNLPTRVVAAPGPTTAASLTQFLTAKWNEIINGVIDQDDKGVNKWLANQAWKELSRVQPGVVTDFRNIIDPRGKTQKYKSISPGSQNTGKGKVQSIKPRR